jgi:hypothetical protein
LKLNDVEPVRFLRRRIALLLVPIGRLYTDVPARSGRIPNRVYQTWKKDSLPVGLALEVRRSRKLNPDYSFSFFEAKRLPRT